MKEFFFTLPRNNSKISFIRHLQQQERIQTCFSSSTGCEIP
jgi:hypothetical protein